MILINTTVSLIHPVRLASHHLSVSMSLSTHPSENLHAIVVLKINLLFLKSLSS